VGVQKAGTSWWFALLTQHPAVQGSPAGKELHFFDRFWDRDLTATDIARYHACFPRPATSLAGEWTTGYLFDPWTPALLARAAPDAKVLVLLRDPLARYRSGVGHHLQRGAPLHPLVATDAMARGRYAEQLARLFEHVRRDQVLVLQYEACIADPARHLATTQAFLGLDPVPVDAERLKRPVNASAGARPELPAGVERSLLDLYAADLAQLAALVPTLDLELWPTASNRITR
jgi:hypothetical protein